MPEAEWLLVVYRLPPHTTRLHAEVQRRLDELEPVHIQRFAVLTHDTANSLAALLDLRRKVENEGGTFFILRSIILAGLNPATDQRRYLPRALGSQSIWFGNHP